MDANELHDFEASPGQLPSVLWHWLEHPAEVARLCELTRLLDRLTTDELVERVALTAQLAAAIGVSDRRASMAALWFAPYEAEFRDPDVLVRVLLRDWTAMMAVGMQRLEARKAAPGLAS